MKVSIREQDGVNIIDLEGNIDINSSNLVETVGWLLTNGSKNILCNLEGVNLVDYVGISLIAVSYKNVLNHNAVLKFVNVPSHIRNLFSLVGMQRILEVYESEKDALLAFQEERIMAHILRKQLRRRFTRVPLKSSLEYKQKFSPRRTLYKGSIVNISGIGLFVSARKIFSIGEILSCKMRLTPQLEPVEVDAKVVWLADRDVQPEVWPGMGLEFYNMSSQQQEEILRLVEKHLTHTAESS
jgi:stage II sporulation protein AA (anti-sigma F factor antagonist)